MHEIVINFIRGRTHLNWIFIRSHLRCTARFFFIHAFTRSQEYLNSLQRKQMHLIMYEQNIQVEYMGNIWQYIAVTIWEFKQLYLLPEQQVSTGDLGRQVIALQNSAKHLKHFEYFAFKQPHRVFWRPAMNLWDHEGFQNQHLLMPAQIEREDLAVRKLLFQL